MEVVVIFTDVRQGEKSCSDFEKVWFKGVSADVEGKGRARVLDGCPFTM